MSHNIQVYCLFLCVLLVVSSPVVFAQDATSTNFKILAPVIQSGDRSTSVSFGLQSIIGQLTSGTSSATNFKENIGYLMYPFASSPSVSATAGDAQVDLSWSASSGVLGWTVSSYTVGQSTASGGPYSYTSLGNVTSSTRTSLTNGTTYYFVIVVEDAFGNFIATSTEVSATPTAAGGGGAGGGGGGGGGGGSSYPGGASVTFSGNAYPYSKVILLKDAQIAVSTVAGGDAKFEITLSGLAFGNYLFSLRSEDKDGRRSTPHSFPITLDSNSGTKVGGIFIAPTIDVDKSEVRKGDNLTIFGQTVPSANVVINVNSENEMFLNTASDKNGVYLYTFDTSPLEYGGHAARSKSGLEGILSDFGYLVNFKIGDKSVLKEFVTQQEIKGDVNNDQKVNVIDFSIVAYWYQRPFPPAKVDLNGDGAVTIIDFSIMAFYWTG